MGKKSTTMPDKTLLNKTSSKRNGKIDLLKFLFAVTIAIYHFNCSADYPHEIFNSAYIAVEFFFIVSGYFMAKSLSKFDSRSDTNVIKESLVFIKKKYFSFFKYHVFMFIVTVVLWIPYFDFSLKEWLIKLMKAVPNFFLLKMFGFNSSPWLMAEWYLSSMMIVMFILAPVMIKHRKLYSCYFAPVLSLALICFVFGKHQTLNTFADKKDIVWLGNLRAFAEISAGCIVYEVSKTGIIEKLSRKLLIATECICYLVAFTYLFRTLDRTLEPSVLIILTAGITISVSEKASLAFLNNKFIYFLGKLSLSIYLCHSIVRYCSTKNEWTHGGYFSHMAFFLITTFLLSLACLFISDWISKIISKK